MIIVPAPIKYSLELICFKFRVYPKILKPVRSSRNPIVKLCLSKILYSLVIYSLVTSLLFIDVEFCPQAKSMNSNDDKNLRTSKYIAHPKNKKPHERRVLNYSNFDNYNELECEAFLTYPIKIKSNNLNKIRKNVTENELITITVQ